MAQEWGDLVDDARCPACGGDPELCILGPTGCSPRYDYDPETGEMRKPTVPDWPLDPSPLVPEEWPSPEERADFRLWETLTDVKRRYPLTAAMQDFLDRYERGEER